MSKRQAVTKSDPTAADTENDGYESVGAGVQGARGGRATGRIGASKAAFVAFMIIFLAFFLALDLTTVGLGAWSKMRFTGCRTGTNCTLPTPLPVNNVTFNLTGASAANATPCNCSDQTCDANCGFTIVGPPGPNGTDGRCDCTNPPRSAFNTSFLSLFTNFSNNTGEPISPSVWYWIPMHFAFPNSLGSPGWTIQDDSDFIVQTPGNYSVEITALISMPNPPGPPIIFVATMATVRPSLASTAFTVVPGSNTGMELGLPNNQFNPGAFVANGEGNVVSITSYNFTAGQVLRIYWGYAFVASNAGLGAYPPYPSSAAGLTFPDGTLLLDETTTYRTVGSLNVIQII